MSPTKAAAKLASDSVAMKSVLIASRQAAEVLCDRATLLILLHAHAGARLYSEFAERTGLATRLLSIRLTQLVEDGLLVRIPYSRRPLRHAYHLTYMGADLSGVLALLASWERSWSTASKDSESVIIEHRGCPRTVKVRAAPASVLVCCAGCGEPVNAREMAVKAGYKVMTNMPAKSTTTRRTSLELAGNSRGPTVEPLRQGLSVLGDKWTNEVLVCAFFGVQKFVDFGRYIGIATNILTDRLNRLVEIGLMRRTTGEDSHKKGLYLLTEKGRDFYGILIAIDAWASAWTYKRVRAPFKLQHSPCESPFKPILVCTDCGQAIANAEVTLHMATASAPEPARSARKLEFANSLPVGMAG